MIEVPLKRLSHSEGLDLPLYQTSGSVGVDLSAALEEPVVLSPNKRALIPTGFAIALPNGYEAQVRSRSGLAFKQGITVLNSPGTIDQDYRGEIKVILINLGQESVTVVRGMRIAQLVFAPALQVRWRVDDDLPAVQTRGTGGFGSTGSF